MMTVKRRQIVRSEFGPKQNAPKQRERGRECAPKRKLLSVGEKKKGRKMRTDGVKSNREILQLTKTKRTS